MEINAILNTEESRKSFLTGLLFIAKADGSVDDSECQFFHDAAIAMGIDTDSINSCWAMEVCPKLNFSSLVQKKFFLREAIQLSFVNDHYADEEKELVKHFAAELGVSDSIVRGLEEWAQRGMVWKREGDDLLLKGD